MEQNDQEFARVQPDQSGIWYRPTGEISIVHRCEDDLEPDGYGLYVVRVYDVCADRNISGIRWGSIYEDSWECPVPSLEEWKQAQQRIRELEDRVAALTAERDLYRPGGG